MRGRTAPLILASLLAAPLAAASGLDRAESEVIEVAIDPAESGPDGDAPGTVITWESDHTGPLHVWVDGPTPLVLRVEDANLEVLGRDGGGRARPHLLIEAERGTELIAIVEAPGLTRPAQIALHLVALPGDALEADALEEARAILADVRQLQASGDRELAREALGAALDVLEPTRSDAGLKLVGQAYETAAAAGEFEPALRAARLRLERHREMHPPDAEDLLEARSHLGWRLYELGRLDEARSHLEAVLAVRERVNEPDDVELYKARHHLAPVLRDLGDLARAVELQRLVLEVTERTLREGHLDLTGARVNLAATFVVRGDLLAARPLLERGVADLEARADPQLPKARLNLVPVLFGLGDSAGALRQAEKSLEELTRTLPGDHPILVTARQSTAAVLIHLGRIEEARALIEAGLEALPAGTPAQHPYRLQLLNNMILIERASGDPQAAADLAREQVAAWDRIFPAGHPRRLSARVNLATTLVSAGRSEAAATAIEELLAGGEGAALDPRAGLTARTIRVWARAEVGPPNELAAAIEDLAAYLQDYLATALWALSPREAEARAVDTRAALGALLSATRPDSDADTALTLESVEAARSLALASRRLEARLDPEAGGEVAAVRAALRRAGTNIAGLALAGAEPALLSRAAARREELERRLRELLSTGAARTDLERVSASAAALAEALAPDEAAVAYWTYERLDFSATGEQGAPRSGEHLTAFVLRAGVPARRVELASRNEVEAAVRAWRAQLIAGAAAPARGVGIEARASSAEGAGERLRTLVIDPLLRELEGVKRLTFVPDGALHLVPLDALPYGEGVLAERWSVARATGLAPGARETGGAAPGGLVALGDPRFEGDSGRDARAPAAGMAFAPLPGARAEVEAIADLYAEAFPESSPGAGRDTRLGDAATHDALVSLAPSARWLHVATHGWFAPETIPSVADVALDDAASGYRSERTLLGEVRGLSPLVLCGLALAGASLADDGTLGPGLITGEELALLDLSLCELAVLSACETHVGEARPGQGLASLQLALHAAGARAVVTSLWRVPDEPTRELMVAFYRHIWLDGLAPREALGRAKAGLRASHPPRDWAGWVLTVHGD